MAKLSEQEISVELAQRGGWTRTGDAIEREFEHEDFPRAVEFVNSVAAAAEDRDHHPDILIHGYNKVTLTLTTHSDGGLTAKDFGLAHAIDGIADAR